MCKWKKYALLLSLIVLFTYGAAGCYPNTTLWNLQYGAEGSDNSMLVVQTENFYGYADPTGKVIIEPQYREARPFYEGLAAVRRDGKFGYIDKEGKTVIPFRYDGALDFHNGWAIVITGYTSGIPKYCIIDKDGAILKETDYTEIFNYSDGAICVNSKRGAVVVKNDSNEIVQDSRDKSVYQYSNGLALAYNEKNNSQFFIDMMGNNVFGSEYRFADPFSEGFAAVRPSYDSDWGYIDQTGAIKIPLIYNEACPFGEGIACVRKDDGNWIIIDKSGNEVAAVNDRAIERTGAFSEGLCSVEKFDRGWQYWGYIDTSGKLAIEFKKYAKVTPFKNGIAQVLLDGKIGYIDKTGRYIWEPK